MNSLPEDNLARLGEPVVFVCPTGSPAQPQTPLICTGVFVSPRTKSQPLLMVPQHTQVLVFGKVWRPDAAAFTPEMCFAVCPQTGESQLLEHSSDLIVDSSAVSVPTKQTPNLVGGAIDRQLFLLCSPGSELKEYTLEHGKYKHLTKHVLTWMHQTDRVHHIFATPHGLLMIVTSKPTMRVTYFLLGKQMPTKIEHMLNVRFGDYSGLPSTFEAACLPHKHTLSIVWSLYRNSLNILLVGTGRIYWAVKDHKPQLGKYANIEQFVPWGRNKPTSRIKMMVGRGLRSSMVMLIQF